MTKTADQAVFDFSARRWAGILLHPTSLPGHADNGDMGHDAYRFIEFLASAGISIWQALPLGPTHADRSPYQCLSVHAGNPALISLEWLQDRGWLEKIDPNANPATFRQTCLQTAYHNFEKRVDPGQRQAFTDFCAKQKSWLDDYSLYSAIRQEQGGACWNQWPAPLRRRQASALEEARQRLTVVIEQIRFEQFVFFSQWHELKDYAHKHGVCLFGDMPIFVAHDSADVWSHQDLFLLDEDGQAIVVAGVPPDYFSETGQRWGNPLYNWEQMEANGFRWWTDRMLSQLELFDIIRIDHFRGFEAYWEIPASAETAIDGQWVKAPGQALLKKLHDTFSGLPLVAEDLGIITEEVDALRQDFHLPGMKILQFAFGSGPRNPYLPHNHEACSVVYTGTHDNDTTLSWYQSLDKALKQELHTYSGCETDKDMPWPIIHMAFASVAGMAIIPMQDILGLGEGNRMNLPGTIEGNWGWRFQWEQVPDELAEKLCAMLKLYGRLAD